MRGFGAIGVEILILIYFILLPEDQAFLYLNQKKYMREITIGLGFEMKINCQRLLPKGMKYGNKGANRVARGIEPPAPQPPDPAGVGGPYHGGSEEAGIW